MFNNNVKEVVLYAPIIVHLFVYIFTCLLASVLFCVEYEPFVYFVEYFSGTRVPVEYSMWQRICVFSLLFICPILLIFGFHISTRIRFPYLCAAFRCIGGGGFYTPAWGPSISFILSFCVALFDLSRGNAYQYLSAWGDYGAWVDGRWQLFSALGFFDFVNIYLILPVSAAWLGLSLRKNEKKNLFIYFILFLIVVLVELFLFQKKAIIVSSILMIGAFLLDNLLRNGLDKRLVFSVLFSLVSLFAAYIFMVVYPVYSETSRTASEALLGQKGGVQGGAGEPCQQGEDENVKDACREVVAYIGLDRKFHILAYAFLAPMTRTSLPAMYYPIVFPEVHEYYGLDLGQDILGYGRMPDDNLVVWQYMNPQLPGGSAGAPYQFILYSQVGLFGAMFLTVLIGLVLGWLWQVVLDDQINIRFRSLMGTVLLVYCIYLAIDSARGGFFSSYGVLWAWLFLIIVFSIGRAVKTRSDAQIS
ncbi:hypothetical protein [Thalassospira xiamenensis]|uniref:Oligosaccharide repeat unit polymerase n=1 Tax=Thalassospira xiamenensis TaxID=220697 RepID=A0A367XHE6_9PROT|nr:hypothetical protein [Thalassospira xiamenensis]KZB51829.1 hypothetical protein AUP41_06455 [Thalassospira xiamenensis]MCK2167707.1 hypothetical protein [Thalassospira xiamenensis]RCK53094.1 hypothetical protein TH44_02460 [Thalassospira xiamenensis]